MKHYLHIWALWMLFIHLSTLGAISFLPSEGGGMAFKKVCLRQEMKGQLAAANKGIQNFKSYLLLKAADSTDPSESELEVRLCSVKLISTPAAYASAFTPQKFLTQEPPFLPRAYYSLTTPTEPDPPRIG